MADSFETLDYLVVLGYLTISLGLGFAFRKQSGRDEFFTASQSMGRITVGLSVMATLFSANSFVMYPSTGYGNSIRVVMAVVAFWSMSPIVIWVFIPVYSKLKCATAYEYLEQRFHVSVRCLASALFVILRIAWMAAATYAASLAIGAISGMNQYGVIVGLGLIAIAYTMLGGLRAVMWTDVLQFFVFFGTILFAAALLVSRTEGGVHGVASTYFEGRDNMVFDFRLDPTFRFATIAILLGSFLEGLSAFGADQVAVQRYIAARNTKTSQTGFLINLLGMMIVIPGLLIIGMGLFSFFHHNPALLTPVIAQEIQLAESETAIELKDRFTALQSGSTAAFEEVIADHYRSRPRELHADMVRLKLNDQALPQFVRLQFPAGMVGLLVAALMAATMSSIDSGVHSVTTALVVDFRDRLKPQWRPKTEAGEMRAVRVLVVVIGSIVIVLACFVGQLGDVFAVAKKSVGAFAAPLLAVFVMGLFIPRATTFGVFVGTWIGAVLTFTCMTLFSDWFAMWFFPLGFFSSIGISMLLSLLPLGGHRNDKPLTFWRIRHMD